MGKRVVIFALFMVVATISVQADIIDSTSEDDSWTEWAKSLFAEGSKSGENAANAASQGASDAKEEASNIAANVKVAVGEAANKAVEGASNVYKQATDKTGRILSESAEKASQAYGYASEKGNEAKKKASETASETYNVAANKGGEVKDKSVDAKAAAGDKYETTKESVAGQAKQTLNTAKEKASQAAGEIGEKVKSKLTEL